MSIHIPENFVEQYSDMLRLLAQQKGSRLYPYVTVEATKGTRASFDYVGITAAQDRVGRHGDTPIISTPHSRRWVGLAPKEWGDMIDKPDQVRTLTDPTNKYLMAGYAALGRAKDDVIINSFFGDVYEGQKGTTLATYGATAYDGTNPENSHFIPHDWEGPGSNSNSTGLTIDKLRAVVTIMRAREVIDDGPTGQDGPTDLCIALTSGQINDLLGEERATNRDYGMQALVDGRVNNILGLKVIRTERLLVDGSGYRRVPVWHRDGIGLALGSDLEAWVERRFDKRGSWQAYACWDMGAGRIEDSRVYEIKCEEPGVPITP